ncbi:probable plastid-lipid-associated protein 13, chloroplastic [Amborella trichopoda]|uniref:probable plastid-lipid-associated protein 13, chloroplastic n=1 Tax=Amborella trichopoda TaxID=13333 RepID=UPI0005D40F87|nr:probable plastid-lipid-associated protein 13, chloroplastic [Amborella trichopoda]|eukprot:XP_011625431.1 probable plastid-lipid-associated protein 13, chloroplastic [Amborella trichopoda]
MAAIIHIIPSFTGVCNSLKPGNGPICRFRVSTRSKRIGVKIRAVAEPAVGAPAFHAQEMERLAAKESLMLALQDSGGYEALVTGSITNEQKIDVTERITSLERLNPTPRPTSSPYVEGQWKFLWWGSGTPLLFATRYLFEIVPSALASLSGLDALFKDGFGYATASLKFINAIESKVTVKTKFTVEGPIRLREEYVEGLLEPPSVSEEAIPEQLKGAYGQASGTLQQFPDPIKDAISNGLKIPLSGTFQRMIMISYLDEEIFILRNVNGEPEVLSRQDAPPSPISPDRIDEYES